jgi:hypothetical protein
MGTSYFHYAPPSVTVHMYSIERNLMKLRTLRLDCKLRKEEVAGSWGTPHNEELYNLRASPSVIKSDQIMEIQRGGVYSTHRKHEKCI